MPRYRSPDRGFPSGSNNLKGLSSTPSCKTQRIQPERGYGIPNIPTGIEPSPLRSKSVLRRNLKFTLNGSVYRSSPNWRRISNPYVWRTSRNALLITRANGDIHPMTMVVLISDKTLAIVARRKNRNITVLHQSGSGSPSRQATGDKIVELVLGHLSGVTQEAGYFKLWLE